ncbi:MAG: hypothetical protein ABI549_05890 [Flavobacterium sp.]|uniref:hypothetical protein n=1 Tax=Flavobacterium sp. TaxID=239 RepID=UPI003266CFE5
MKKVISILSLATLLFTMTINAQETKPAKKAKAKTEKTCSAEEKKSCSAEKKGGCCSAKKAAVKS